jgi:DNA-binding CsgD family transcriptional regulator
MSAAPSPASTTAPSPADVCSLLLDIHERSNTLGYHELHRFTLRRLAAVLPFDGGLLAMGTIQDGVPHGHDVVLHERPPEFMASWEEIKHEDKVALHAFTNPGRTGNFDIEGPIFDGCDRAREHCRKWGIAHVLCTSLISSAAGLYWVASVYRSDRTRPFSEEERQAMQLVVPHIFAAARNAHLGQLRARTRFPDAHGQAAAIANECGLVLEAEPGFIDLMRAEWPRWVGPSLPADVRCELSTRPSVRIVRDPVVVRADRAGGFVLLHARRTVPADTLTAREREIAEGFSLGETYRELGERLGLSPNTVRRHLANIYEKLGIASKAELDRMISGLT